MTDPAIRAALDAAAKAAGDEACWQYLGAPGEDAKDVIEAADNRRIAAAAIVAFLRARRGGARLAAAVEEAARDE
jgi:hypothetical protein